LEGHMVILIAILMPSSLGYSWAVLEQFFTVSLLYGADGILF